MRVLSIETTDENLKYALKEFDKNGGFEIEFNKRAIIINILAEYAVNNIDTKYINTIIAKNECECTLEFCDYIYENIKKYINRKLR